MDFNREYQVVLAVAPATISSEIRPHIAEGAARGTQSVNYFAFKTPPQITEPLATGQSLSWRIIDIQ